MAKRGARAEARKLARLRRIEGSPLARQNVTVWARFLKRRIHAIKTAQRLDRAFERYLMKMEAEKELSGDEILQVVVLCLSRGRAVPPKIATRFCDAHRLYGDFFFQTLDEALGLAPRHLSKAEWRNRRLAAVIVKRVLELHAEGRSIGEALFDDVAREFRQIKYPTVKRIWDDNKSLRDRLSAMFKL